MRVRKVIIQNWIGDSVVWMGVGMATIAAVLLASDIIMQAKGSK